MAVIAGVETHWREAGTGSPLILLHGLGASSYSWRVVIPELAKSRRVIAPDMPGFGRSGSPRGFDYSLKGLSRWLVALLDHLGVEKADVAGNSLGGVVSLMTAMDEPARIRRLALLGAPVYLNDGPVFVWPIRWPLIGRLYEALLGPTVLRLIGRTAYQNGALMTEDVVREYALPLATRDGRWAMAEVLRRAVPRDAEQRMARYRELRHPILMIRGKGDTVAGSVSARRFCGEAPNARLLELDECHHVPQEERPADVLAAFKEFFA